MQCVSASYEEGVAKQTTRREGGQDAFSCRQNPIPVKKKSSKKEEQTGVGEEENEEDHSRTDTADFSSLLAEKELLEPTSQRSGGDGVEKAMAGRACPRGVAAVGGTAAAA